MAHVRCSCRYNSLFLFSLCWHKKFNFNKAKTDSFFFNSMVIKFVLKLFKKKHSKVGYINFHYCLDGPIFPKTRNVQDSFEFLYIVLGIYNFSLSNYTSWGYCSTILSGGPIFVTLACSFLVCTLMCFKFKSLRESEITVQKILMQFKVNNKVSKSIFMKTIFYTAKLYEYDMEGKIERRLKRRHQKRNRDIRKSIV